MRLICRAEDLRLAELNGGILFPKIQSYSLRMPGKLSQHQARKSTKPATETPQADVFFIYTHTTPILLAEDPSFCSNMEQSPTQMQRGVQCEGRGEGGEM